VKRDRRQNPPLPDQRLTRAKKGGGWVLRLYVAGMNHASARAVERVRALCDRHLAGQYDLEVIDIYQLPALARGHQIVATPTLIRTLPVPLRRYIGDLSDENVLFGLDLLERRGA
jgi:circadian clock protein KaiB